MQTISKKWALLFLLIAITCLSILFFWHQTVASGWKEIGVNKWQHQKARVEIVIPPGWLIESFDRNSIQVINLSKATPPILQAGMWILIDNNIAFYKGNLSAFAKSKLIELKTKIKNVQIVDNLNWKIFGSQAPQFY